MDAQKSNNEALTAQFPPNPTQPTQTTHPAETGEIFGAMTAKEATMTEQEQNEVLARWLSERIGRLITWNDEWGLGGAMAGRGAFTVDLNSMALIEGAMNEMELPIYRNRLVRMFEDAGDYSPSSGYQAAKEAINATAAQRAEAACRALNLWKDGEN